jgi:hypothetical protein
VFSRDLGFAMAPGAVVLLGPCPGPVVVRRPERVSPPAGAPGSSGKRPRWGFVRPLGGGSSSDARWENKLSQE